MKEFIELLDLFDWELEGRPKISAQAYNLLMEYQRLFFLEQLKHDPGTTDFKFFVEDENKQLIGKSKTYYSQVR